MFPDTRLHTGVKLMRWFKIKVIIFKIECLRGYLCTLICFTGLQQGAIRGLAINSFIIITGASNRKIKAMRWIKLIMMGLRLNHVIGFTHFDALNYSQAAGVETINHLICYGWSKVSSIGIRLQSS